MKKIFFLSALAVILVTSVYAQTEATALKTEIKVDKKANANIKKEKKEERKALRKLEGNEVSYKTKQAFQSDFRGVTAPKWKRLPNFDEATFSKDGNMISTFYDYDSKLVGTTQKKSFSDLPVKARKYIAEKYKGYTPGDVLFFDDNESNETDMILYDIQFDDEDSYFAEIQKDSKKIVLRIDMNGDVQFYTNLK